MATVEGLFRDVFLWGPGLPGWDSFESETEKLVVSSVVLRLENNCAGEDQRQLQTIDLSSQRHQQYRKVLP
jgi:hypothetical protein